MKDVKRAGKVISGSMPWTDETKDEIIRAFQIANNWRDSHAYPVKSVRSQVIYYLRELGIDGSTFARLKRGDVQPPISSQRNPLPWRVMRPTDGEGKCAVQHSVWVSQ